MLKRVLLLTGAPGVGKTTVLERAVESLRADSISVGGMISREVREGNVRVGFEILDLTRGKRGWLSHVNGKVGPAVGKYRVNLADLDNVGAQAIVEAIEKCSVVTIDEIGPMEVYSSKFNQAVKQAFESGKPVLAVVHAKAKDTMVMQAKKRADAEIFTVSLVNRDSLPELLKNHVTTLIQQVT